MISLVALRVASYACMVVNKSGMCYSRLNSISCIVVLCGVCLSCLWGFGEAGVGIGSQRTTDP